MSENIQYNIKFATNGTETAAAVGKIGGSVLGVNSAVDKLDKNLNNSLGRIQAGVGRLQMSAAIDQVNRVADGLNSISNPAMNLSTSMFDLQAITGVAGDKLKEIEGYARFAAKQFGGDAAASVESYKLILSQLSPEIANKPAALKAMGNSVATLSKTMGGDSVAATEVLTTAMNQYGISTADPIKASEEMARMMNVMAAGAKEGSAELPQIKSALEQSGMAASAANVAFEETNAAIQVLDKAGKKGSEGGVALRNVMATLSEGRFLPKDVKAELAAAGVSINTLTDKSIPLADRLKALQPIMNDSALFTKLFGKENSNAALALVNGIPEMERLTVAITGTNTAYEQAAIVMESPAEKAARLKARIEDVKISMFNATGGALGYVGVLGDLTRDFTNLVPAIDLMTKGVKFLTSAEKLQAFWTGIVSTATGVWTGVQWVLNAALWASPITWIVAAVVALVAAIAWVVSSTEGWGAMWQHTVKAASLLWQAFTSHAKFYWDTLVNGIMIGLNYIKQGWYEFQNATGIGDESANNAAIQKIHNDTEARKKAIIDGAKNTADLYKQSAVEFKAGINSIHLKPKTETSSTIKPPIVPGTENKPTAGDTGDTKKDKKGIGKQTTDAIATGGTKSTTIHIQTGVKIDQLTISGKGGFKESSREMEDIVMDSFTRAVAMGASLGA